MKIESSVAPGSLAPLSATLAAGPSARALAPLAALVLIFLAPYLFRIPWRFAWATGLLLLWAFACYRLNAIRLFGLRAPTGQLAAALLLGVAVWWSASTGLRIFTRDSGLIFVPFDSIELLVGKPLFQAFNEELILRALLLGVLAFGLLRCRPGGPTRRTPWLLAVGAALLFSGLHWLYYNWLSSIELRLTTLLSLFFVGFALNAAYLRSGHVYFGVAIHAGWNLVRFGGRFYVENPATGGREYIVYARTFNLLEGDPRVLAVTAGLAVVAALLLIRQNEDAREKLTIS